MTSTVIILLCMAAPAIYIVGSIALAKRKYSRIQHDAQAVVTLLRNHWEGQDDAQIIRRTGLSPERFSKTHYLLLNMGAELTPEGKWVLRKAA